MRSNGPLCFVSAAICLASCSSSQRSVGTVGDNGTSVRVDGRVVTQREDLPVRLVDEQGAEWVREHPAQACSGMQEGVMVILGERYILAGRAAQASTPAKD